MTTKLKNLKIGEKFRVGGGKIVWIKRTVQGMNSDYSYVESELPIKNKARKTTWNKLLSEDTLVNKC